MSDGTGPRPGVMDIQPAHEALLSFDCFVQQHLYHAREGENRFRMFVRAFKPQFRYRTSTPSDSACLSQPLKASHSDSHLKIDSKGYPSTLRGDMSDHSALQGADSSCIRVVSKNQVFTISANRPWDLFRQAEINFPHMVTDTKTEERPYI